VSQRQFLPAAGRDVFLPLYDPLVRLMGIDRARQKLVAHANIESGHHVLDLGCGTGTLAVMLKRRYSGLEVVGLDPDPKALRRARMKAKRAGVSVQFDEGFADELPYEEASFDRVLSSFMFHHLAEHERAKTLVEVARVLKPGGLLLLVDFVADHSAHGFLNRLFQSHAQMKANSDEHILELMSRAGLRNPTRLQEGRMLFGLLRTSFFQASAN
jgi:ubiquinone/menaquinone biosynthesis C-methylase UbiE